MKCRIIIRCNAGELAAINEALRTPYTQIIDPSQTGGVDDLTLPGDHIGICRTFLKIFRERLPICVVMTGSTDYIGWTDPQRVDSCSHTTCYPQLTLSRTCILLTHMTGAGCMSNTLIAAFASVADSDGHTGHAAQTALAFLVQSAQEAQKNCRGMGSFRIHLMDELSCSVIN